MSETARTQAQHMGNVWAKAVEDQVARIEEGYAELAKLQTAGIEQACKNVDEATRLTKESFAYATELTNHWRKVVVEATKKTADFGTPKV